MKTASVGQLDVDRFTEGECHYLARAIHVRTGWPIMAFESDGRPDLHAFVRMPDGRLIDVQGVSTVRQMKRRWGSWPIQQFSWPELRRTFGRSSGRYIYARAAVVADRLLGERDAWD